MGMNKTADQCQRFYDQCVKHGFNVLIDRNMNIVTITKSIEQGNLDQFVDCDVTGPLLLDMVPLKGGSVWGTDSGSVGGHVAVNRGRYTLNKSGYNAKRFMTQLSSIVGFNR